MQSEAREGVMSKFRQEGTKAMEDTKRILGEFASQLFSGAIEVVDLSAPLGPDTPLLKLPPGLAGTPKIEVHVISEYDGKGPSWAWNWLKIGEHSGTHLGPLVRHHQNSEKVMQIIRKVIFSL